jgi:para-aminobenzoate synthetase/4-amino-4-deoxychorismate lyase
MRAVFDRRTPDPAQGVFETLLVLDGRPVELDAHLARLEASLAALFPAHNPPPLDVPGVSGPYASSTPGTSGPSSLRVTVAPGGDGALGLRAERRDAPRGGAVALDSLVLPDGLGAHKWADRSLLDEAQARLPAGALPLIVDAGGTVLEASRASVFAMRDGALFTPPLDGRILPGITRMRVLEIARAMDIGVREEPLTRGDLLAAGEVFLTGSVRGVEPVASLDGMALGRRDQLAAKLDTELRRTWTGARVG